MRTLEGQWAVVTGASKGIGFGIATSLAGAGAGVVLVARDKDSLEEAAEQLRPSLKPGQQVLTHAADTSDREAVTDLFARLERDLPRLNVLVANAGTGAVSPFLDLAMREWDEIVSLNLTGSFQCLQLAGRLMRDRPSDNMAMLAVSSVRAVGARPGRAVYSATKAGLNQLVRVVAVELAPLGIRVNILSPGITETPMAMERNRAVFDEAVQAVPMARAGTLDDMGEAALYLCSPSARFVTGANLNVDGGEHLS